MSPARPGEQISIGRFLAGHNDYQRDPYAVLAASVSSAGLWISRPLAWSFVATSTPEFWAPGFDYLGLTPRARTEFDGRDYTIFGIDWRRIPVDVWLDVMAERELTGEQGPIPAELQRAAPLSRPQFDDAVRAALRDLARPDRLGRNALTESGWSRAAPPGPAPRCARPFSPASAGSASDSGICRWVGCWTGRSSMRPRPRRRRPRYSTCRSRPIGATCPGRSTS